ncbi:hypothetical protein ACN38_g4292, partial [Penicillium nordicum]
MYFTAPSVALLALAAGVQAGGAKQHHEPPVQSGKGIGKHQASGASGTGVQTGTHPIATGHHNNGTGTQTGSHPIVTGTHNNGTHAGGKNSTIIVTGTAPCFNCHGSSTIPVNVPTKSPSASGGAGHVGGGSSTGTGTGTGTGSGTDSGTDSGSGSGSDSGSGSG